jgi:hypothetical protein
VVVACVVWRSDPGCDVVDAQGAGANNTRLLPEKEGAQEGEQIRRLTVLGHVSTMRDLCHENTIKLIMSDDLEYLDASTGEQTTSSSLTQLKWQSSTTDRRPA